jgi:hypothetical protein
MPTRIEAGGRKSFHHFERWYMLILVQRVLLAIREREKRKRFNLNLSSSSFGTGEEDLTTTRLLFA